MGAISSLDYGVVDAVEHVAQFLDQPDNIALSEAFLAPKPKPRPCHYTEWTQYRPPRYGFGPELAFTEISFLLPGCPVL